MQEQLVLCYFLTSHQKNLLFTWFTVHLAQQSSYSERHLAYGNSFILSNYIESYECEFLSSKAIIASVLAYYVK